MTRRHFPIIIEQDVDGVFIVTYPVFKGCHSYGSTIDEAIEHISEAIGACIKEADGTIYKYGKGRGQHFWDTIFKDVGKAVNGMAVIDTLGWATLPVAGWWAWRGNRKRNAPELVP